MAKPKLRGPRRVALAIARAFTVLAVLGTIFGLLGDLWWGFDLASHFQVYYCAGALMAVIFGVATRKRGWTLLAASIVVYSATALMQFWSGGPAELAADRDHLRAVHFNVLSTNAQKADVGRWLAEQEADIIVVQEVDEAWVSSLEDALQDHRLELAEPRSDRFGMAVFARKRKRDGSLSKVRAEVVQLDRARPEGVPAISVRAHFDDREVAVLGIHTLPPVTEDYALTRHRQLAGAAEWAIDQRGQGRAPIVIGDLNATQFCADFDILRTAGLLDSARGFGYVGSFPAYLPQFAALPIDHAMHDVEFVVVDRNYGPELGSDHRPLSVTFAWRTPPS